MKRSEIKRRSVSASKGGSRPARRATPKKKQLRRDWSDARAKVDGEGACRLRRGLSSYTCEGKLEAAHVIGREHDPVTAMPGFNLYVRPQSVVPLCKAHHGAYDRHEIDVLHVLDLSEQLQAVRDAGSVESMRRRTAPTAYRPDPRREAA